MVTFMKNNTIILNYVIYFFGPERSGAKNMIVYGKVYIFLQPF